MAGFGGTGKKYLYSGQDMPNLYEWAIEFFDFNFDSPNET